MAGPPYDPLDLSRFQKHLDVVAGMQKQIESMHRQWDLASGNRQVIDTQAAFERVGGISAIKQLQQQYESVASQWNGPSAYEQFAAFNEALALDKFREQIDVLSEAGALSRESGAPVQEEAAGLRTELEQIGSQDNEGAVLDGSTLEWIDRLPTATQFQLYLRILNILNLFFMVVAPQGGNVPDTAGRAAAALIAVALELANHLAKGDADPDAD
jgi:hypothetical protein